MDIPNNLFSNLIQIPVVLFGTIVAAAIKRRCIDVDTRTRLVWRLDIVRQTLVSVVSMALLISIAILFQGSDTLNLMTLVAVDITLGCAIDAGLVKMLRVGGMKVGDYGINTDYSKAMWQAAITTTVCISSRCTSAIAAIFMFPFANDHLSRDKLVVDDVTVAVGLPLLYFVTRLLVLDSVFAFPRHYESLQSPASDKFCIECDDVHTEEADAQGQEDQAAL
jgi:hypothetical protein